MRTQVYVASNVRTTWSFSRPKPCKDKCRSCGRAPPERKNRVMMPADQRACIRIESSCKLSIPYHRESSKCSCLASLSMKPVQLQQHTLQTAERHWSMLRRVIKSVSSHCRDIAVPEDSSPELLCHELATMGATVHDQAPNLLHPEPCCCSRELNSKMQAACTLNRYHFATYSRACAFRRCFRT